MVEGWAIRQKGLTVLLSDEFTGRSSDRKETWSAKRSHDPEADLISQKALLFAGRLWSNPKCRRTLCNKFAEDSQRNLFFGRGYTRPDPGGACTSLNRLAKQDRLHIRQIVSRPIRNGANLKVRKAREESESRSCIPMTVSLEIRVVIIPNLPPPGASAKGRERWKMQGFLLLKLERTELSAESDV